MVEQTSEGQKKVFIDFEPIGRRVEVPVGTTLLEAAQEAGIEVVSLCGGHGLCDSCRMRPLEGQVSPHTINEENMLDQEDLDLGFRLGCQTKALNDLKVEIPASSLATTQRLQIEGKGVSRSLNPPVRAIDLNLAPPTFEDLRSDQTRLMETLRMHNILEPIIPLSLLQRIPEQLRENEWSTRAVLRDSQIVTLLPADAHPLGLAVDIGTTKLAGYLVNLESGKVLAQQGAMNPQIGYGEDVISRITYADSHKDGGKKLNRKLIDAIQRLTEKLCAESGENTAQIVEAVMVGNTAMHHFLTGLPVSQLGKAPYVPAVSEPLEIFASDIGLSIAPAAKIYIPPNIAGYVGADHVAMLLATDILAAKKPTIALDIGTNTEITLAVEGHLFTCSTASGPAFEGAHIHDGMRAAAGAIERAQIEGTSFRFFTIDNRKPIGLCGSGILDVLAELVRVGALEKTGHINPEHDLVAERLEDKQYILVPTNQTGHGKAIYITRQDVSEIQLAKGAIRTGINLLLEKANILIHDLSEIIIAGAFGTYLNPKSAVGIGMFPDIPLSRYRQIGNAAGAGAIQLLTSVDERDLADKLLTNIEYVELTTHAGFQDAFMEALYF